MLGTVNKMLTVVYNPVCGPVLRDGHISQWVNGRIAEANTTTAQCNDVVVTSSELAVRAIRNAVLDGRIRRSSIQFKFCDSEPFDLDVDGFWREAPTGFCDMSEQLAIAVLGLRAQLRRDGLYSPSV